MSEVVDTARPWPHWMLDHMLRDDEATLQALLASVARSPPDGGIAPDEAGAVRELVEAYRGAGRAPEACYDAVRPFLRRQPERLRMLELFRCYDAIASRPDGYPLSAADEGLAIAQAMREPAAVGLFQLFQAGVSIRAGAHEDAAQRSLEALEMLLQAASARPACAPRIRAAARNAVLLTARGGDAAAAVTLLSHLSEALPAELLAELHGWLAAPR